MTRTDPPLHVVPVAPGHGVVRIAHQLAEEVGADRVDLAAAMALPPTRVHLHVTDRIFGATAEEAATALVGLARRHRTTVTWHDLPQPSDGAVFDRRARAYRAVLDEVAGSVVSSEHEARLLARHLGPAPVDVVPLPVLPLPSSPGPVADPALTPVVGLLGWIYPGKGHAEVIEACAGLPVTVRALGRVSPGHDDLVDDLEARAESLGVGFETVGWIPETELAGHLDAVDVPVAAHRHVSASGSINSWTAARRRPLVRSGDYAAEMARLRPGTLALVDDADLHGAIAQALRDPSSTRLRPDVDTAPHLHDCAAAYLDFWAER